MQITPAIKGKITKAIKNAYYPGGMTGSAHNTRMRVTREVFQREGLPPEQAKHAARKYLRSK